jgi:cation transport ATPase
MTALFFISLIAFVLGLAFVTLKYGIPESISESYYLLPPQIRLPVFYVWTVLVALPLVIFWLDISGETAQALVFFGCAFLIFVGASAPFKDKDITHKVHVTSAALCALLTQIWIFIYTPFWFFTLALTAIFFSFGLRTKGTLGGGRTSINSLTFFLELAAFLSVYFGVYGFYKLQL